MTCPKCKNDNVTVQAVNTVTMKRGHGLAYKLFIGWWMWAIKLMFWCIAFVPMLIIRLISGGKKYRMKSKTHSEAVCQSCGYHWQAA